MDAEHYASGSIQNGHLAGSIANAKLSNSSVTVMLVMVSRMVVPLHLVLHNLTTAKFCWFCLEDDCSDAKIAAAAAGTGLAGGGGSALSLDLSELGDTPLDVANDSFVFVDN